MPMLTGLSLFTLTDSDVTIQLLLYITVCATSFSRPNASFFLWPGIKISLRWFTQNYFTNLTRSHESAYQWPDFLFIIGKLFIHINWLWRACDTQWLGLGVWGRCILYIRQKLHFICTANTCVSYACQSQFLHINSTQIQKRTVLLIHIFMTLSSPTQPWLIGETCL